MAKTPSQANEIARRLEERILRGEWAPGMRLDERSLAEQFGVSRTPVREAIQWLSAQGMLSHRGRQGISVTQLTVPDLLDAFYIMSELEAMAAAQAARRIRPEQIADLRASADRCAEFAEKGDAEGFYLENLVFHQLILEGTQNRLLDDQMRKIRALIAPYRRYVTSRPGRMKDSVKEHEAVMQAIINGEPAAAAAQMRNHVNLLGDSLSDFLHQTTVDESGLLSWG